MNERVVWMLAGALALALGGCSDSNDADDAGAGSGAVGGAAGFGGSGAVGGTSGAGGTGGINTAGTGGNAGTGGFMFGDGGMQLTCDDSVPTTATCGGTECPTPMFGSQLCVVPCCVGNECGTRNTSMELGSDCALAPEPDPSCPDVSLGGFFTLTGCCTPEGTCGGIDDTITNSCIDPGQLPGGGGGGTPQPCGEDADAGI